MNRKIDLGALSGGLGAGGPGFFTAGFGFGWVVPLGTGNSPDGLRSTSSPSLLTAVSTIIGGTGGVGLAIFD